MTWLAQAAEAGARYGRSGPTAVRAGRLCAAMALATTVAETVRARPAVVGGRFTRRRSG